MADGLRFWFSAGEDMIYLDVTPENVKYKSKQIFDREVLPSDTRYSIDLQERDPKIKISNAFARSATDFKTLVEKFRSTSEFKVRYRIGGSATYLFDVDNEEVDVKCSDFQVAVADFAGDRFKFTAIDLDII
jgi:hypothetical protein